MVSIYLYILTSPTYRWPEAQINNTLLLMPYTMAYENGGYLVVIQYQQRFISQNISPILDICS